jgi:hypothetical protein
LTELLSTFLEKDGSLGILSFPVLCLTAPSGRTFPLEITLRVALVDIVKDSVQYDHKILILFVDLRFSEAYTRSGSRLD